MRPWVIAASAAGAAAAAGLLGRGSTVARLLWSGGSYEVKPSDRLWLLRAVQAESGDPEDRRKVAQTLVNRFIFLKARGSTAYPTLSSFVRAYAQPINPLWASPSTPKCQQHPSHCTPVHIERRKDATRQSRFDDSTLFAVREALHEGIVSLPPSAIHYAAPGIGAEGKVKLTADRRGHNTFYATSSSRSWPGYRAA